MQNIITTPKIVDRGGDLSKRWFVDYYIDDNGKKKRVQLYGNINKFLTSKERYNAANLLVSGIIADTKTQAKSNNRLHLLCAMGRFLVAKKPYWRKKTYRGYKSQLRTFWKWCNEKWDASGTFGKYDADSFCKFLKENRSNMTYNNYLLHLGAFFKTQLNYNPFEHFPQLVDDSEPFLFYNSYQKTKLIDYIKDNNSQLFLAVQFIYYCFIRPGEELRGLKIKDISLDERKIRIRSALAKNHTFQYVTIPTPFYHYLKEINIQSYPSDYYVIAKGGKPGTVQVAVNYLSKVHQRYVRACNLDDGLQKLYSWKHTGIKALIDAGVGLPYIQQQCRHHSLDMLQKYVRKIGAYDTTMIQDRFPTI